MWFAHKPYGIHGWLIAKRNTGFTRHSRVSGASQLPWGLQLLSHSLKRFIISEQCHKMADEAVPLSKWSFVTHFDRIHWQRDTRRGLEPPNFFFSTISGNWLGWPDTTFSCPILCLDSNTKTAASRISRHRSYSDPILFVTRKVVHKISCDQMKSIQPPKFLVMMRWEKVSLPFCCSGERGRGGALSQWAGAPASHPAVPGRRG